MEIPKQHSFHRRGGDLFPSSQSFVGGNFFCLSLAYLYLALRRLLASLFRLRPFGSRRTCSRLNWNTHTTRAQARRKRKGAGRERRERGSDIG